jgi:adenosylhomocysteine nucleosidase
LRAGAALVAIAASACGGAVHGPKPPPAPEPLVIVSADAEWAGVRAHFPAVAMESTPYGETFERVAGEQVVRFFHGGWGKIAAAGSAQYAIDRWHPSVIVNLGTCGGFGDGVAEGETILVDEAIVYDIVERMGDPAEAIREYTTKIDLSRWPALLRSAVRVGHIASGDRDLAPEDLARLKGAYGAIAGDWESGAIAWVGARAHVRVLILRVVTDVVGASGDPTYGAPDEWQKRANAAMGGVIDLFEKALPSIAP